MISLRLQRLFGVCVICMESQHKKAEELLPMGRSNFFDPSNKYWTGKELALSELYHQKKLIWYFSSSVKTVFLVLSFICTFFSNYFSDQAWFTNSNPLIKIFLLFFSQQLGAIIFQWSSMIYKSTDWYFTSFFSTTQNKFETVISFEMSMPRLEVMTSKLLLK